MKISYSITVCNESVELEMLLAQLHKYIPKFFDDWHEVIIIKDANNSTSEVQKVIDKYSPLIKNIFVYEHSLNNDFADHKNFVNSKCTGDYVFNLDADEIPSSLLLIELIHIIEKDPNVDLWWVPRINIVKGMTEGQLKEWNWNINNKGFINYPDYQSRIYKNKPEIQWTGKVHEHLIGAVNQQKLPMDEKFCLLHVKSLEKQKNQNSYYSTL